MSTDTPTTRDRCSLHSRHPLVRPAYCERHHTVPVAWQLHWQPKGVPLVHTGRGMLWDVRLVAICRTGHGNVHEWLVAAMRELPLLARAIAKQRITAPTAVLDDATLEKAMARGTYGRRAARHEREAALLGMQRYRDAGGDLLDLCAHGLFGFI